MPSLLSAIVESKRREIETLIQTPLPSSASRPKRGLLEALRNGRGKRLSLLTEIKFRSPSAGDLSRALSAEERATVYARGGATAISVLVDEPFFGGSFDVLKACRTAFEPMGSDRPYLLCKEFILHPVQLEWARAHGADTALLIVRILSDEELPQLIRDARNLGLEPLVEVATEAELERALDASASIIGVNARDLDTLEVDAARARRVLSLIPEQAARLYLSGISTRDTIGLVRAAGADAALIGEALMRVDDPTPLLRELQSAAES